MKAWFMDDPPYELGRSAEKVIAESKFVMSDLTYLAYEVLK